MAAVAAGAAGFALAELLSGLSIGGFVEWGRLHPAPFLEARPWLLLAAAVAVSPWPWRTRLAFYGLALALAAVAETALLSGLAGSVRWAATVPGLALAAAGAVAIDLAVQAGRRWRRGVGTALAAALVGAALAASFLLYPPGGSPVTAPAGRGGPDLRLMTALPIVWGEGGAFDPASYPAESYRRLLQDFRVRPIDSLDRASLAGARLLLLAQPRWLDPAELVALDDWVRAGGRVLALTDPALVWPSELPQGDVRRPPPVGLLGPLLDHWGLALEPAGGGVRTDFAGNRKLAMDSPGRFTATGSSCRVAAQRWLASCALGRGRAILVADADLMRDDLWIEPRPRWRPEPPRIADNPLIVADLLDRLAGLERPRFDLAIAWVPAAASYPRALAAALLPILAALGAALLLRRRGGE